MNDNMELNQILPGSPRSDLRTDSEDLNRTDVAAKMLSI